MRSVERILADHLHDVLEFLVGITVTVIEFVFIALRIIERELICLAIADLPAEMLHLQFVLGAYSVNVTTSSLANEGLSFSFLRYASKNSRCILQTSSCATFASSFPTIDFSGI